MKRKPACSYVAITALVAAAWLGGCGTMQRQAAPDYQAIVAAPDRSDGDRRNDARRAPARMLEFSGVHAGMKVLDLGAGGGYSSELLARAVGPQGVVFAQDSNQSAQGQSVARFAERMKTPAMKNVVRVIRAFDDPVPPEARDLDLVTFFYIYHDTPSWDVDRARMNRRIFEALKPGGIYLIADHAAKAGDGVGASKSLHRIEESVLRREVEAAGFRLAAEGTFLRNPEDKRDERVFGLKIPVDNFVLKFVKP